MDGHTLAIHGGTPVRERPLAYQCIGGNLIGEEELALVTEVVKNKTLFRHYGFVQPHMVDDFEREAAAFIGSKYVLAVSTGSGAYFCTAAAFGWGPGDEVIIPTYGWITDYSSVALTGAVPVFADIDESFNMSPEAFEAKITPKTKAVMVIHYQGCASRLDEIVSMAHGRGIQVIEDAAQACGGVFKGVRLGMWGDISCYSLQTHKMITSGDGGFLATDDQELYERAVRFHDLGLLRKTFEKRLDRVVITRPFCGMQWRMNELSGAVALAQLRKLPDLLKRTKQNWEFLRREIVDVYPDLRFRKVEPKNDAGIVLAFDLRTKDNVRFFSEAFEAEGLLYGPTSYCQTMDRIDVVRACLEDAGLYVPGDFETTERIVERFAKIAVLPVYGDQDMHDIARGVVKVLRAMKNKSMI